VLNGGEGRDRCDGGTNVPGRTSTKIKDSARHCEVTRGVP